MTALLMDDLAWKPVEQTIMSAGDQFGTQSVNPEGVSESAAFSSGGIVMLDHFRCGSSWIADALAQVRALRDDWDGYGAPAIEWRIVRKMSECLHLFDPSALYKPASLVPGADGSLQAEWHLHDDSVEFRVDADESVTLTWTDRNSGASEEWFDIQAMDAMNDRLLRLRR